MPGQILLSWIGRKDLDAAAGQQPDGPVLATLRYAAPAVAHLLYNYAETDVVRYLDWLQAQVQAKIIARHVPLRSPVDFSDIYEAADTLLQEVCAAHPQVRPTILLSPGTPAMQAVWILLGKTRYTVEFLQSSPERGVEAVDLPFNISAEFLPARNEARRLRELLAAEVPASADFERIITGHPRLLDLKRRAAVLARFDVPVLILGETGTGKELFARAIHNNSGRRDKPFIALNCGAIPGELIDSTLFGHVKGAFTGAVRDQPGAFEQADGGTLFLDELGELPAAAQVRMLRVLQEGVITRVGGGERPVDVRVLAATHRDLQAAIAAHQFREDLYYRIAVGVLELPPLRERQGDISRLIDHFLGSIPASLKIIFALGLTPDARNLLLRHTWPGNVRELHATLVRAALWTTDGRIHEAEIAEALIARTRPDADILSRPLGADFDLDALLREVEEHYLRRALAAADGSKSQASRLLGLGSHQVLGNRLRRCGLEARDPVGQGNGR
jgi:transcriptional regulator with PAS, ATPase and Fis domain